MRFFLLAPLLFLAIAFPALAGRMLFIPGASFTNTYSIQYDGTAKAIRVTDAVALRCSTQITAWAWVKGPNTGGEAGIFAKADYSANKRSWFIERHYADTNKFSFWASSAGTSCPVVVSNTTVFDNTWHFIAVAYDAGHARFYVDGSLDKDSTGVLQTSLNSNDADITIGSLISNGNIALPFNGYIDEPGFGCFFANDSQIGELRSGTGKPVDVSTVSFYGSVVEWWRNGDGDTLPTILGKKNGYNGTATGLSRVTDVP